MQQTLNLEPSVHLSPQARRVLDYLQRYGSITPDEAKQSCGCGRLAARILDLHKAGIPTTREMIKVRNQFEETVQVARYRLEDK